MEEATIQFIQKKLTATTPVVLLYVLYSEGSSPGRQGFQMVVAKDDELFGSIGGGIMEHKLVELSKTKLTNAANAIELKQQFHNKSHKTNQSGMICSGHQIVAFFPLYAKDIDLIQKLHRSLLTAPTSRLLLSPKGISIIDAQDTRFKKGFQQQDKENWYYTQLLKEQKILHIFGGGHVSLALSEVMHFLGFYIKVYEDRPNLNTLEQNVFCNEKHIQPYDTIGNLLNNCKDDYVVIMTFGYRPDKVILLQLLEKSFFYIGLMGSKAKIKTLLAELAAQGYPQTAYQHVFTPIGLKINSKTTREIAVSIAAEMIKVTNVGR